MIALPCWSLTSTSICGAGAKTVTLLTHTTCAHDSSFKQVLIHREKRLATRDFRSWYSFSPIFELVSSTCHSSVNIRQGGGGGVCPTGPYPSTCMYYAVQACSSYIEDGGIRFPRMGPVIRSTFLMCSRQGPWGISHRTRGSPRPFARK